jgi:protein-tyrosine phosphatase
MVIPYILSWENKIAIMRGLTDLHVHLLAGLDDGPRTWTDSLEMCRIAVAEGVRYSVALAHQSDLWALTPDAIREAVQELTRRLTAERIPLEIFASAEIMATPDLARSWAEGRLLSVGDRAKYLMVEMPNRVFVDLRPVIHNLADLGLRVILAHPERHPELLHDPGRIEELIGLGCLVQVSSGSVSEPRNPADAKALRDWFRRGCVHLLGSDGHSPRKRKPLMASAAERVRGWIGGAAAERICAANGLAILRGEVLAVPPPIVGRSWWALRMSGR